VSTFLAELNVLAQLRQEFDDGVLHAYLGPRVEGDAVPWAFEVKGNDLVAYTIIHLRVGGDKVPMTWWRTCLGGRVGGVHAWEGGWVGP
jgi:hypothetical protein